MTCACPYPILIQTPFGCCWSVPGHAGIEATREEAEAQIRKHQETAQ